MNLYEEIGPGRGLFGLDLDLQLSGCGKGQNLHVNARDCLLEGGNELVVGRLIQAE